MSESPINEESIPEGDFSHVQLSKKFLRRLANYTGNDEGELNRKKFAEKKLEEIEEKYTGFVKKAGGFQAAKELWRDRYKDWLELPSKDDEDNFYALLKRIQVSVESHSYTCVLGDDKSARILTLIIGKTINGVYRSKGESVIPILFIDPKELIYKGKEYPVLKQSAQDFIHKAGVVGGRVLIVTDMISTGRSLLALKDIVGGVGLQSDFINKESYWGDIRGGLTDEPKDNQKKPYQRIHSQPLFIEVKTEEDVERQYKILSDTIEMSDRSRQYIDHYLFALRKVDPKLYAEKVGSSGQDTLSAGYLGLIRYLSLEQKKSLFKIMRHEIVNRSRARVNYLSKQLTERFNKEMGRG